MPISIKKKEDCCGCSACEQICPTHSITMSSDSQGFLYPYINLNSCINCGLCEKSCPVASSQSQSKRPLKVFAAKHIDQQIRLNSSSGGLFSALAEHVIQADGVVYGAQFDANWSVVHAKVDNINQLHPLRGSKYVQSDINACYKDAKTLLDNDRLVIFSGTPCQIYGLQSFLGKSYPNLYLIDVICHGVPSPQVWKHYINSFNEHIVDIQMRDKSNGWRDYAYRFTFRDKTDLTIPYGENPFAIGFINNLYLRPSCYNCQFKAGASCSDITLGDYWGIQNLHPEFDDNIGVSLVIIQSQKGLNLFKCIDCKAITINYDDAVSHNQSIIASSKKPIGYHFFWRNFAKIDFKTLVDQSISAKPSIIQRIIYRIKRLSR